MSRRVFPAVLVEDLGLRIGDIVVPLGFELVR